MMHAGELLKFIIGALLAPVAFVVCTAAYAALLLLFPVWFTIMAVVVFAERRWLN